MTSRGAGTAISRKNYRLSTEPEKSKVAGIVNSRLLNDYLHRVFSSADGNQPAAAYRYGASYSLDGSDAVSVPCMYNPV
uniref:Uncharacterized protein n=1 Tax=Coturnix japonica TaxID=93934 RepID=A0A8C2TBE3_COTJA